MPPGEDDEKEPDSALTGPPEAITAVIVKTALGSSDRRDAGADTGGDRDDPHVLPVAIKAPPPPHLFVYRNRVRMSAARR